MIKKYKKAFSLIELSIVLLIISILIAGAVSVSTVAITNAKAKVTRERMDAIYKAIGNFVARNYRLPCPASLKEASSSLTFGESVGSSSVCGGDGTYQQNNVNTVVYGAVPVVALNLPYEMAQDGYGSKFSYVVNAMTTEADYPDASGSNAAFSFYPDSSTDMIIIYQLPSGSEINGVAFALISHGANKYGAFNYNTSSQISTSGADTYEASNAISSITDNSGSTPDTANFGIVTGHTNRVVIVPSNSSSDVFDDIVMFKTRSDIISDFDLGFLKPCTSSTTNWASGYSNAYAGTIRYRSTACASPNDSITPSKECGALASAWIDRVTCP